MRLHKLRSICEAIYPTIKNAHMDTIMNVLWHTDFKQVEEQLDIHFDYRYLAKIKEACKPKN